MKRNLIISICLGIMTFFASPVFAQTETVKGTVIDENGEPIIGASVMVEGEKGAGTITDLDGNYTVSVPKNGKVVISYIGYVTQTVKPGGTIQMKEDSQNLEEVVVVGYGSQKKAHLTGSVATVDMNELQDLSAGGLASMLEGLVNGVSVSGGDARPGENATIYIRDTNSLGDIGSTAQQPLFVIDGYIYPNDVKVGNSSQNLGAEAFNNLDPSVIESISVLKDASAAVYGARAANGVILVTTKKGKMGAPSISYNGQFGITDAVAMPKMLSAYDYGRLYNAVTAADPTNTSLNHTTALYQADELEAMKSLNYDLLDKYWEKGFTQKHSVNVSGASERASYFGGVSYFKQDGNLGKLDYDRYTYRAGFDVKISDWLKANISVSGDHGEKNTPNVKVGGSSDEKDFNLLSTRPRYIPEYVTVGGVDYPISAYGISNSKKDDDQYYNHELMQNNGDYSKNINANTTFNASLTYDFGWSKVLKGLTMSFTYAKSISTSKSNQYGSDFTVYSLQNRAGSGSHLYTPVNGTDFESLMVPSNISGTTISNGSPSYLSRGTTRTDNYQMNFTVNYAREFGQHHVSGLFSIERSEAESEYNYGYVSDPYPFTTGQSNSAEANTKVVTFTRSESASLSYIGRVNYNYASRYLLEFLLRADSSTKFAPENMWGYFPSLSAGWVISEEPWFENKFKGIDYMKLRASWGLTGRDNTAPWQWMQVYAQDANRGPVFGDGNESLNRITINKNNSAVNRAVSWDKSYKANIGIDMNVLNSRLAIGLDAYRVWNRDMLMNMAQNIQATIGTQSAAVNLGEMDSWGYELSLTWKDKIGKDLKYKIGLNTGYSDNKVLNMDWVTDYIYRQIVYGKRSDIGTWGMQCIGMFRSFQDIEEYFADNNITSYMGYSKDQVRPGMLIYKDIRGAYNPETGTYAGPDGIVDRDNDQVCLSNRNNPYGFTTNISVDWKGFSLSTQFQASWGGYSFIPGAALKPGDGLEFTNMPSFWNPDDMFVYQDIYDGSGNLVMAANQNGSMPNLAYSGVNSATSNFWRISGTRIKWTRLTLAYALPKSCTKVLGVQSVRFNLTGHNLLSFYNPYPDNFIDPMTSYGAYPSLRQFNLGVSVTF